MIQFASLFILLFFALPIEARRQTETQKPQTVFDPYDPTDAGAKTGPAVGETIPKFAAMDQTGKLNSFQDIKGTSGAVILFHRSADW